MSGRTAAKLALLVASFAIAVVAVEAGLRLADIDYSPMRVEDEQDDRAQHLFASNSFVYDPVLIWRPRAGRGVFNRQGFRGAVIDDQVSPTTGVRVATVGDSNTLGWQGLNGAHWPGELERLLREENDDHRVINAGVWGYSSHQGVSRLRQVLALAPDLVTISFGSNDAHPVLVSDSGYADHARPPEAWKRILGKSRLGRLAMGATVGADAKKIGSEPTRRVPLADYRRNLQTMVELCRAADALPVFLTRPYLDSVPEPPRWKGVAPGYNRATVEVAIELDVPVVDLYTLFKTRAELFADESHFTAEGHRLAAEVVLSRVQPLLDVATTK